MLKIRRNADVLPLLIDRILLMCFFNSVLLYTLKMFRDYECLITLYKPKFSIRNLKKFKFSARGGLSVLTVVWDLGYPPLGEHYALACVMWDKSKDYKKYSEKICYSVYKKTLMTIGS
jgi:hypothetical protein